MQKKPRFKPVLLALATFANGTAFAITQVKRNGACRITELVTKAQSYSHGVVNAWKSVCFQADLNWRTNRTLSADDGAAPKVRKDKPKTDGVKRHAVTVPNLTRKIHRTAKAKDWTPQSKKTVTIDTEQLVQVHDVYRMVKDGKVSKQLWHRGALVGSV